MSQLLATRSLVFQCIAQINFISCGQIFVAAFLWKAQRETCCLPCTFRGCRNGCLLFSFNSENANFIWIPPVLNTLFNTVQVFNTLLNTLFVCSIRLPYFLHSGKFQCSWPMCVYHATQSITNVPVALIQTRGLPCKLIRAGRNSNVSFAFAAASSPWQADNPIRAKQSLIRGLFHSTACSILRVSKTKQLCQHPWPLGQVNQ